MPFGQPEPLDIGPGIALFDLKPYTLNTNLNGNAKILAFNEFSVMLNMYESGFKFGVNRFTITVNVFHWDNLNSQNALSLSHNDVPDEVYTLKCEVNYIKEVYNDIMVINNFP